MLNMIALFSGDSDDEGDHNSKIAKAKAAKAEGSEFPYSFRDVILYSTFPLSVYLTFPLTYLQTSA